MKQLIRFRADPAQIEIFWTHREAGHTTYQAALQAGLSQSTGQLIVRQAGGIAPRTHPTPPAGSWPARADLGGVGHADLLL